MLRWNRYMQQVWIDYFVFDDWFLGDIYETFDALDPKKKNLWNSSFELISIIELTRSLFALDADWFCLIFTVAKGTQTWDFPGRQPQLRLLSSALHRRWRISTRRPARVALRTMLASVDLTASVTLALVNEEPLYKAEIIESLIN